jgi:hypothetical protein
MHATVPAEYFTKSRLVRLPQSFAGSFLAGLPPLFFESMAMMFSLSLF